MKTKHFATHHAGLGLLAMFVNAPGLAQAQGKLTTAFAPLSLSSAWVALALGGLTQDISVQ